MKNKTIYLAVAIFIIGIFLRTYHFTDWLHFELDQARDVFIISDAIDGIRDLPLLGPQARGRELQLGPIFYYFQFFSAKIFGVSPVSVAFPDLLFSILTIPLSYFFARQFFSKRISFLLFAMTSSSYFLIVYGRFAWNPNSMPFWSMLAAYSLLKVSRHCSIEVENSQFRRCINLKNWFKNKFIVEKKISWWFVLAVCATSILMQLHFIAFLCFPVAFFVYFIFSKIQTSWKTILVSMITIILLCLPVIINEYKTGGQNTRGLIGSVTEDRNDDHDLIEKTIRSFQETATFYFTIFTGDQHGRDLLITKKQTHGYFPLICDKTCKERLPYLVLAIIFFLISLATFPFYIFKRNFYVVYKKSGLHRNRKSFKLFFRKISFATKIAWNNFSFSRFKKYFRGLKKVRQSFEKVLLKKHSAIFLIVPWFLMGGLFLTLVAYQISPRFYLFMYPPFLILLGSVFYFMEKVFVRFGKFITVGLTIILVAINFFNIKTSFTELNNSINENIEPSRDLVMKRSDRITLGQLEDIADYILESNESNNKIVVGDNRYARAIYYLVSSKSEKDVLSCYVKRGGFDKKSVQNRNFYVLVREKTEKKINEKMLEKHKIVDEKSFGTLKLYELNLKDDLNVENVSNPIGCFVR